MAYKISGNLGEDSKIIIINESNWDTDTTSDEVSGNYEVTTSAGNKLVTARKSDGHSVSYGDVEPILTPGDRGVFAGGASTASNTISYITISSTGDSDNFGDLTDAKGMLGDLSNGGAERGVFSGNYPDHTGEMDFITINSLGDAQDFGDCMAGGWQIAGLSNSINDRGIFAGNGYTNSNVIQYITISTTGNAQNFGDLITGRGAGGTTSNGINNRGIYAGGGPAGNTAIEYINIATLSDSIAFGNLSAATYSLCGTSNGVNDIGVFAGGRAAPAHVYLDTIEYITITSLGDADDFGNLTIARDWTAACSNRENERAVIGQGNAGTNIMDYITINSPANAAFFGNLPGNPDTNYGAGAVSNS